MADKNNRLALIVAYRRKKTEYARKRLEMAAYAVAEGGVPDLVRLNLEEALMDAEHAERLARLDAGMLPEPEGDFP